MTTYDDDVEFDLLQRRAEPLGVFAQRHRDFDPCRPGGEFYLMEKRRYKDHHAECLLKYATLDECHIFLNELQGGSHG
jgi:hypothetical protein